MNGDFHVADDGVTSYIGDQLFLVQQSDTSNSESEPAK
jgi:hypothetical protein